MTVSHNEFQAGIHTSTEELSENLEQLDSLEEMADSKAYNLNMGRLLSTLMKKTPEVEKKQKIGSLMKTNT